VTSLASPETGGAGIRLFATLPQRDYGSDALATAIDVAQWSEEIGCEGILIYDDNRRLDPWFVAGQVILATDRLEPLVAVQPAYLHPYAAARKVWTLSGQLGRRLAINVVAGGYSRDLDALGESLDHDVRYRRAFEYTHIVRELLRGRPVSFSGSHYSVERLSLPSYHGHQLEPRS
jgi:alkanesulfonate monooxygenase